MVNKSIAYRLKIYISLAVICVFLVLITVNYLFNRKLLRENIEIKAIGLSSEINSMLNQSILTTREVSRNVAGQLLSYVFYEDAEQILSVPMFSYPFLNAIHGRIDTSFSFPYSHYAIFRENGKLLFQQNSLPVYHCAEEKEVFEGIPFPNGSGWTEPYLCSELDIYKVAYYTPVIFRSDDGEPVNAGQVISELSLIELNDSLNRLNNTLEGTAFLVTAKGDFITHPNRDKILNMNLFTLPAKVFGKSDVQLEELLSSNRSVSMVAYPEYFNFKKTWLYLSPINETGWFMIYAVSFRQLFSTLYLVTFRMIIFSLAGIVLILFFIHIITRKQIEPLSILTTRLNRFNRPAGKERSHTKNEVKQVSDSLDYLKALFDQYKTALEKEEMSTSHWKQDLQQASEIQQSLIKTGFPAFPDRDDIDLYALYKPALVVSGDLFDYFFIDDDNLVFTIGDVSGKGIPAAIFMSVAQTIIKNVASFKKAKTIVSKANSELCTANRHQYFLTLILGVLNVKKGELTWCNAAHNYPFLIDQKGKVTELKTTHGLPLGLCSDKVYTDTKTKLQPGDTLVLYTDGVTDLQNQQGKHYRVERLKENLRKMKGFSPQEMVAQLNKDLEEYRGDAQQSDDICLLVIKFRV